MPKLSYPVKPWLIQCILEGKKLKTAKTLQVLQHVDGPLDDGTMVKIVGDGSVIIKAYFPRTSYEKLEDTQQECWEQSLIRITDWDINLKLMDTKEKSDYIIIIKMFDVWNNEEGFRPKDQMKPCKFNSRILEEISKTWEEESYKRSHENLKNVNWKETAANSDSDDLLTLLVNQVGVDCFTQTEDSIHGNMLPNQGLLKTVFLDDLQKKLTILSSQDFVITPEENKILEAIPEWYKDSIPSTSSVSKTSSLHSNNVLVASTSTDDQLQSTSKPTIIDNDNEIEPQQITTTTKNIESCIVLQPNTCDPQRNTSSEVETVSENPSEIVAKQKETNPEIEAQQQQTISKDDATMISGSWPSTEHQSENNMVSIAVSCHLDEMSPRSSQNNSKITSQSNDNDIEEETRLHNLALPLGEAADQHNIQQAKPTTQYENHSNENDLLNSEDSLLKVTSTDNDEYGFSSSLEFSSYNDTDLNRNVQSTYSNCDSSQETNNNSKTNSNSKTNNPGPSYLVTSTANESCHLPSSNVAVFNYNVDSNLPVPQNSNYSSIFNNSDNINFNQNEVVTSTAKELDKPELRNTYLLKSNSNKRVFSTYQMDSIDNIFDYNQPHGNNCQFNASTYASPSKRKHTESQDNTEESKLDALMKLTFLLKIPLMTTNQKIVSSWSFPENILAKFNTYWSNSSH